MPNLTIRQQLIQNLFDRLKLINTGSGYLTDIGHFGFRWKTNDFAANHVPGFTLNDGTTTSEEAPSGLRGYVCQIEIIVGLNAGTDTAEYLIKADADIFKCIGLDAFFNAIGRPGAAHIHYTGTDFSVKHEEKVISGLTAKYDLRYRTKLWDPFTT